MNPHPEALTIAAAGTGYTGEFFLRNSNTFSIETGLISGTMNLTVQLQMKCTDLPDGLESWIDAPGVSSFTVTDNNTFDVVSPPYTRRALRLKVTNNDGSEVQVVHFIHFNQYALR